MQSREELIKRFVELDKTVQHDDVIVALPFDLPPDSEKQLVDGLVGFTKEKIKVYRDGTLAAEYSMADVKEIKCVPGIGCTTLEILTGDEQEILLCRSNMSLNLLYATLAKRLNRYLESGVFDSSYEEEVDIYCPKCHRPYSPGSNVCPHCADKKQYLKRVWEIAKPYKGYIIVSVVMYFVISALNLLGPYFNRILVDDYIKADQMPKFAGFLSVIGCIFGVSVLSRILTILRSLTMVEASNRVIVKLRSMVFNKIEMLSLKRVSKRTAGELINRITGDTETLQNFITYQLGDIVQQLLVFVSISVLLFIYDWRLALMILLPVPFIMVAYRLFWRFIHKRFHKQWTLSAKSNSVLHDIFSGIRVVKAFGMEKAEMERYDKATADERDISIANERTFALIFPVIGFFMGVGEFFLLYYVGSKILGGTMTLGEMQQFSSYVSIIYGPLSWMANFPRRLVRVMTSIIKIFDIIDEKVDVADKENAIDLKIEGHISIEDISFGYDESKDVLRHVSLEIKPGEFIGIVGKSGVGKSTLINLVMRLYDVDDGCIKIDGHDIRDISQESLRSQIGVVLQETFLFSGTIYENIVYAKPDATREEVITAAKLAGAHQFIMKLPDAYNTKVGERGYTLSGGERQRVAIARALLHDPKILILDEATSALDTETEKQIQDALQRLAKNRTTLAIAHRLSTLRNATRLVVLDKGTVAEVGTHDELMKNKNGIYYGLVMAQRQMSRMAPGVTKVSESA
ncbi:MAG: ABC transporter transmembrane domain-containing protein [Eubacteriales bacterium]|jgi:ATP-binding cassette subfamily B protein|nr:ATP-binding cassette domain-containing protein [Clostridiales bacterium]